MRLFWGDHINDWRVWGLWIKKTWFIGFSVVDANHTDLEAKSDE